MGTPGDTLVLACPAVPHTLAHMHAQTHTLLEAAGSVGFSALSIAGPPPAPAGRRVQPSALGRGFLHGSAAARSLRPTPGPARPKYPRPSEGKTPAHAGAKRLPPSPLMGIFLSAQKDFCVSPFVSGVSGCSVSA